MKRLQLLLILLRLPVDYLSLLLAGFAAYAIRYWSPYAQIRPIIFEIPLQEFSVIIIKVALIWIAVFALAGLYSARRQYIRTELLKVILGCSAGVVVLIALMFMQLELFSSRFVVLVAWGFAIFFVSLGRLLIHALERLLNYYGIGVTKIVIIGSGATTEELIAGFKRQLSLGYRISKIFQQFDARTEEAILKMKKAGQINEIWLTDPRLNKKQALEVLDFAEENHLNFKYSADLLETTTKHFSITTYAGIPVIEFKPTKLEGWGRIVKRLSDIFVGTLLLIITSPIIIFAAILLAIEDGFPIFFINERVGSAGRTFRLFKLRSMWRKVSIGPQFKKTAQNLELEKQLIQEKSVKEGPVYKILNDPRITPVGRFLRRWSLDELPQFWNVIWGDMSLVGPRPHQPREVASYEPRHKKVHNIKPGLTGLAQISGRSDLSFEDEVRLDIYYMENWSPWLDLYILFKTPLAVIGKKGAY
ncbi:MAG: sugar transferase [bacterium]